jgi:hypothetical protein
MTYSYAIDAFAVIPRDDAVLAPSGRAHPPLEVRLRRRLKEVYAPPADELPDEFQALLDRLDEAFAK